MERPTGVTILAILAFIGAGCTALAGLPNSGHMTFVDQNKLFIKAVEGFLSSVK